MVESIAVIGLILSMIRPQQQPTQYHPQYPAQQYYYPQQQAPYYGTPPQQYYHPYQPTQAVASPYGPQGGPQGYYYGQPPQATTYTTGG